MISQSSKYLLAGLFVGLSLVGCSKDVDDENAITANTYPAPAVSVYANDPYDGISYDDSMYLGDRKANLYWYGDSATSSLDADSACMDMYRDPNGDYRAIATSGLTGYNRFYTQAGTQRYGSFRARQGDVIANASAWYDNHGKPLRYLRGGLHLVCFMPTGSQVYPSGVLFMVDANMGPFVNVNLQFNNMQVRFSQPYFGRQFRVAKQFHNYSRRTMNDRQNRNERDNLPRRFDSSRTDSVYRGERRRNSDVRERMNESRREESRLESRSGRRPVENNVGVIQ